MKDSRATTNLVLSAEIVTSADAEIVIRCSLMNSGKKATRIFLLPYPPFIQICVSQKGHPVDLYPKILRRVLMSRDCVVNLGVNQVHVFDVNITREEFVWPDPGIYEAKVVYAGGSGTVEGIKVWTGRLESNEFKLEFR